MAKKNNAREVAEILYTQGYTGKEIALKIGVSEKTISRWVAAGHWKDKKENLLFSRNNRLNELYLELKEFNRKIKEKQGYKVADSKEADARRKLIMDIKALQTEYSLGELVQIGTEFTDFVKEIDLELSGQVLNLFNQFINHTIERTKWQK